MPRGPALDLGARIDRRVAAQPGTVWTPVDFLDLGPRAAVDKSLQRLTADGKPSRIGRGLYYRTATNALTRKATTPDVRTIVDAIARRDQSRIVVDGLTAANDLGLTTAVPARVTVLTDARLRPMQMGKQRIVFQTVAPKRLYWAGRPAMRFVQALYWLRDLLDSDNGQILQRLRAILADPFTATRSAMIFDWDCPRCPSGCSRSFDNSSRHGLEQPSPPAGPQARRRERSV